VPEPEPTTIETYPETTPVPVETTPPTSTQPQETDSPQTTEPQEEISPETTVPEYQTTSSVASNEILEPVFSDDLPKDAEITPEVFDKVIDAIDDATPNEVAAIVTQVLESNLSSTQATELASTPEVLAVVTEEQAEQIFEEIVVEELTVAQADELVAVLNEAPTKVKKAFQETINVFTGVFDSFKMVGQTIPVGERRTLIAVSNTMMVVGTTLRRRP